MRAVRDGSAECKDCKRVLSAASASGTDSGVMSALGVDPIHRFRQSWKGI